MKKEKKRFTLEEIVPLLTEDQLKVCSGMIDNALFMQKQLTVLRKRIEEEGCDEEFQYGSKQTAAMTTYLQMQKSYGVIIRYLTDLMPKTDKTAASVNLLDWVNNN